ncbi:MAG: hypothetical protein IPL74_15120 [Bacteroidetes bacterium]|nr:hypothetical protein [Bacteroidota bacterium]
MTLLSKTDLNISLGLEHDLKKLAKFIAQLYKTYNDYGNDLYNNLKYDKSKLFIPVVITLEQWYVKLNLKLINILNGFVLGEFALANLDKTLLDKYLTIYFLQRSLKTISK